MNLSIIDQELMIEDLMKIQMKWMKKRKEKTIAMKNARASISLMFLTKDRLSIKTPKVKKRMRKKERVNLTNYRRDNLLLIHIF